MIAGLTGGIATGKSTVAARLRELGAVVIDADDVSRQVVGPDTPTLAALRAEFGESILHTDGSLNRTILGNMVRSDAEARSRLEAITHPSIRAEIARQVQEAALSGAPAIFVEAALLVETGSASLYPSLWVVRCEHETQVQRLMKRNDCDRATAEEWISAQMPVAQKAAHATVVIDNDHDHKDLHAQVDAAYRSAMAPLQGQD